jgi:hypothetical protein
MEANLGLYSFRMGLVLLLHAHTHLSSRYGHHLVN